MKFQNKNMSVIAYANGFTFWHYIDPKTAISEMETTGYFNAVKDLMGPGDIVILNCIDGTCFRYIKFDNEHNVVLETLK